jgi:hypothetical protein
MSPDRLRRHPTRRWTAHVLGVTAVIVLTVCLTACGTPRPRLSTDSVNVCYRGLPAATAALHDKSAKLIGVHRVPVDRVISHVALPPSAKALLAGENDTQVCTFAFKGTFVPGQVTLAPPDQHGRYALVLVTSRHLRILASLVMDQLPSTFGRRVV